MRRFSEVSFLFVLTLSILILSGPQMARAAEVSFISGFLKNEDRKAGGEDNGGTQTIQFGGRFADAFDRGMDWFGEAVLTLRSYDAPEGGDAPSDSTSLSLGGGLRMYFSPLSDAVLPFAYGIGKYKQEKEAEFNATSSTETTDSGLFYGAHAGVRFVFSREFFCDLETKLFESALTATTETETTAKDADGNTVKTETETSRTELFIDSEGALAEVKVSLGMTL